MNRLRLPSWFPAAPRHPGESKWGKFSADQWKSFCTVNLPLTLTRLWGYGGKQNRERAMLENFMHLVTAVKLATYRRTTTERIVNYDRHMKLYLQNLLILYPSTKITPYQHMSLHFADQLKRFGPVHSWRCFPFERYNYLMQKIPSNNRFGTSFLPFSLCLLNFGIRGYGDNYVHEVLCRPATSFSLSTGCFTP